MPKPKIAPGIHPKMVDAKKYEQALRKIALDPTIELTTNVFGASRSYEEIREAINAIRPPPGLEGKARQEATALFNKLKKQHTDRFKKIMGKYLGQRVIPLNEQDLAELVSKGISENVDLIKTIPEKYLDGLKGKMLNISSETPFDGEVVSKMLREGIRLRRLQPAPADARSGLEADQQLQRVPAEAGRDR